MKKIFSFIQIGGAAILLLWLGFGSEIFLFDSTMISEEPAVLIGLFSLAALTIGGVEVLKEKSWAPKLNMIGWVAFIVFVVYEFSSIEIGIM